MPLSSYRVLSPVYIEPPPSVKAIPKKIAPEEIKSMQGLPISVASYPWGHYKPSIVKIGKQPFVVTRTANNAFYTSVPDYLKNGFFSQQDDYEIEGMKSAGEDNFPNKHNLIPKMPDIAYITGITPARMHLDVRSSPVNLSVTSRIVEAVDPNKIGYFESKKANLYELLRRVEFDDANRYQAESSAWINFLAQKGFSVDKSRNAEIIGLGTQVDVEKEGWIAAYYPRKGYLVTEVDFHNRVKNLLSRYGLTDREAIEAMKRADMLHEIGHRLGIGGDRASERMQGLFRNEFYTILAENYKGTKWERIYKALSQEGRDYAEAFSLGRAIWDEITADPYPRKTEPLELLIAKFEAQANEIGLSGHARNHYISDRLEETYGPLLGGEPSFRQYKTNPKSQSSKSNDKKSSKKRKGLEALIERLKEEAGHLKVDEAEYISNELAKNPIRYFKDKEVEAEEDSVYETKIDKSNYKSMRDVKDKEAKPETDAKETSEG